MGVRTVWMRSDILVGVLALVGLTGCEAKRARVIKNDIGMEFALVVPGTFRMGADNGSDDEKPVHTVTLTKGIYLGTTEVTQAQWKAIMGTNPSTFLGDDLPVQCVSQSDCKGFCRRLTEREQKAGRLPKSVAYRLPTEAEWEYACRAGSASNYCFGDDAGRLAEYAWYEGNSGDRPHPVGRKKPNAWGLFDMHGNVLEWCADWHGPYSAGNQTDPSSPSNRWECVFRGGSYGNAPIYCRSAERFFMTPRGRNEAIGFRIARSLP